MALLLREALGDSLRRTRVSQSRTLREVSSSARVSLGYLSEVERGRKEASSELLAAICDALDVPLSDVLFDVSESLADRALQPAGADVMMPGGYAGPDAAHSESGVETVDAALLNSDPLLAQESLITQETRVVIPAPAARALAAA
ncbi:helix-turn-helix transcriptional regulator [Rhodococcus sp. HNM0563]|uniref:helix-turn-helix domain-containing protein n=1 Tax=unclassified Rhodococcus (in: high G+C Gram-positive bacteria) TaxID=192944 RepID=UPI00146F6B55|nr:MULTISPECIES: helix-turn-helix transcriptional regulator [unclassified Rhodococcus (in: high G+C Gram-positive bacteria)]MCK0092147.1 helix-turn-helix transcriptional regulator [Rhodococcus sp. F64268]NLU63363.1 helix-turn-helix transcriptional regulator [Rhodococcus sp. HNM0563]